MQRYRLKAGEPQAARGAVGRPAAIAPQSDVTRKKLIELACALARMAAREDDVRERSKAEPSQDAEVVGVRRVP